MTNDDLRVLKRHTAFILFVDVVFILAAIGIFTFTSSAPIVFKIVFGIIYVVLGFICMGGPNKNVIGGGQNHLIDKKDA